MEMKILDLVLDSCCYLMIELDRKHEEYREMNPYWRKRLALYDSIGSLIGTNPEGYTHVRFRRGYANRHTMLFELDGITVGRGNPDWGAPTDRDVFILKIGRRVDETDNQVPQGGKSKE